MRGCGSERRRNELEHAVESKGGHDMLGLSSKAFIFTCEGTGTWVGGIEKHGGDRVTGQMKLDKWLSS